MSTTADKPSTSQLFGYYRLCLEADSHGGAIVDLFSQNVRHLRFLSRREELADGTLGRLPIDLDWAEPTRKEAAVYRQERTLIYAPLLVVGGHLKIGGVLRTLCAPLVYFPARLTEEEFAGAPMAYAEVDLEDMRFNPSVLTQLVESLGEEAPDIERVLGAFPLPPWSSAEIAQISTCLEELEPVLDIERLIGFPALVGEEEIRSLAAKHSGKQRPRLISAAAFALVENPVQTRGVLFELARLAEADSISTPLAALLDGPKAAAKSVARAGRNVPALLSDAQSKAVDACSNAPLSILIGPPGTGKSFTLAAVALEHVYRGESVLFAARSEQALRVVARKLEALLGDARFLVRAGRSEDLVRLKDFVEQLLIGNLPRSGLDDGGQSAARELAHIGAEESALTRQIERAIGQEVVLGGLLAQEDSTYWDSWRTRYWSWRVGRRPLPSALMERYQRVLDRRIELLATLLRERLSQQFAQAATAHRTELQLLLKGLKARTSARQQALLTQLDFAAVLKCLPIWLTRASDVHRVLPFRRELFNLLVVDEATQCDVASCLPLLYRAKRTAITGDPKQLHHISFLSRAQQARFARSNGLSEEVAISYDYREKSLLALFEERIANAQQVVFLDEHYRSDPAIIDFSNQEFYSGSLRVMTNFPGRRVSRSLWLERVEGHKVPGGPNAEEAAAVVARLEEIIGRQRDLPHGVCQSLGVLSPFRAQVEHLRSLAQRRLTIGAMEKHDLLIGTAHAFQGEERDVMLLSLGVDGRSAPGALRFLCRPDVFNVSITRARNEQIVFCSVDADHLPPDSLLRRYLESMDTGHRPESQTAAKFADRFAKELAEALTAEQFVVHEGYPLAGMEIDLLAQRDGVAVGIDLIGYPGRFAGPFPLERYRMLRRAGLRVIPLPYSVWTRDPAGCVRAAEETWKQMASR